MPICRALDEHGMPAPCRHRQVNAACSSRAVEGAVKNVILQRLQQRCCFGVATPAAQQRVEPCKCRSSPPQTCNYFDETEEANVYPIWQHCNISSQITWWCVALGAPAATAQASGVPLSHIATTIGSNSQNSCRKRQIRQSMRTFRQCRLPMFVASCFLRPPCPPPLSTTLSAPVLGPGKRAPGTRLVAADLACAYTHQASVTVPGHQTA